MDAKQRVQLRNLIISHPDWTCLDVMREWEKLGIGTISRAIYNRYVEDINSRYSLRRLAEVPRLADDASQIDESGLARLLWLANPNEYPSRIIRALRVDGLRIDRNAVVMVRDSVRSELAAKKAEVSPPSKAQVSPPSKAQVSPPSKAQVSLALKADYAAIIRNVLISFPPGPDPKVATLHKEMLKRGIPTAALPDEDAIRWARLSVRRKYHVETIQNILYKKGSHTPSVPHAARLLRSVHPKLKGVKLRRALEEEGLQLSNSALYSLDRQKPDSSSEPQVQREQQSPDPNQDKGDRSRFVPVAQPLAPSEPSEPSDPYIQLEAAIDDLVYAAMNLGNSELVQSLRAARRQASRASAPIK